MTDSAINASGITSFFGKLTDKLPDLPSWLGGGDTGAGDADGASSSRKEPPSSRDPQLRSNHPRLTDWLPYTSYKPEEKLFILEARTKKGREEVEAVGFAFELTPPAGMSEETISIFTSIIQAAPTGACMQLHLYATNDLSEFEERYVGMRNEGLFRDMAERRMEYFKAGAVTPLFRSEPWLLRQFRLSLSCTVPCTNPDEQRVIESVLRWRDQVASTLKSINLFSHDWDATELIRYNASILNSQQMFLPDVKPILNYDRGRLVRSQMMDTVTRAQLDDAGQQITFSQPGSGDTATVRTYSVRSYPDSFDAFQAAALIGDFNQTTRAYSCPYLITVGWRKPDFESRRHTVQMKAARATQQAESTMVKFMPELLDKKRDWDIMQDSFAQGKGDVDMYHQIAIFAPSADIIRAEENAKSVWRARGFEIANDTYMGMQGLFASLPMSLTPALFEDIRKSDRFSTKTVDNVIHTAPMVVEWSGVGEPVIPLSGRRGQIGALDLFANTQGNYNAIVVGASGSGKSVFCNELITGYLGIGAKCYVIDVGRSYEKLCGIVGGQYIEFKADSPISMNPFPMIRDLDEDMEIIQPLIAQMAAGTSGQNLSPFQIASIGKAVRLLWAEHNNQMTITHLRDLFKTGKVEATDVWDKEVSDLSTQLDKFAEGGAYAKYFEGPPSINFTSDFVVLELEELKSKKDLQAVILLIMIYRISEEMFLTGRSRKKVVLIDEAWDLLAGGGAAADLIEGGYRRARKYEGAFITATQGIDDYYKTPAATAAMQNADWMFILRQKPESVTALEASKRLDMNDAMKRVLTGIRKVDGEYAEVFVKSPMGMGLLRCVVDPYSLLIYSSKGEDFTRIEALKASGLSVAEAISALLTERGIKTPRLASMQRQLEASYGR
jgi:conjugal transfer ATP-binding protein TraC